MHSYGARGELPTFEGLELAISVSSRMAREIEQRASNSSVSKLPQKGFARLPLQGPRGDPIASSSW